MGYKNPTEDEFKYMEANLVDHGHNVFSVPSAKKDHTSYLVDMEAGTCICPVGINGAPCKHQYILWILGKGACRNFLPLFSPEDRKKYAEIAIGMSLPIEAYAGLHDHNSSVTSANTDDGPTCLNTDAEKRDIEGRETTNSHDTSVQVDEATDALTDFYDFVLKKLPHIDSSYLNGLLKLTKKVKNMTDSNVSSAFHLFGSKRHHHRRIVNRICSVSKRAQKGNIPVQPGQCKEELRKMAPENVRKGAKPVNTFSSNIPVRSVGSKRKHALSQNVADNHPVPKKAGRSVGR